MALLQTDPLDLALDLTAPGKLVFVNGDLRFCNGLAGVAQLCRVAVGMVRGEWFLNLQTGIPYFQRAGVPATQVLLGQPFVQSKTLAPFRTVLTAVVGVSAVTSLAAAYTPQGRLVDLAWSVRVAFGGTVSDSLSFGI